MVMMILLKNFTTQSFLPPKDPLRFNSNTKIFLWKWFNQIYSKEDTQAFGQEIDVYSYSIGQFIVEYLVHFEVLVEKLKDRGIILEKHDTFESITKDHTLTNLPTNINTNRDKLEKHPNKNYLNFSNLFSYFVFKKTIKLESEKTGGTAIKNNNDYNNILNLCKADNSIYLENPSKINIKRLNLILNSIDEYYKNKGDSNSNIINKLNNIRSIINMGGNNKVLFRDNMFKYPESLVSMVIKDFGKHKNN